MGGSTAGVFMAYLVKKWCYCSSCVCFWVQSSMKGALAVVGAGGGGRIEFLVFLSSHIARLLQQTSFVTQQHETLLTPRGPDLFFSSR